MWGWEQLKKRVSIGTSDLANKNDKDDGKTKKNDNDDAKGPPDNTNNDNNDNNNDVVNDKHFINSSAWYNSSAYKSLFNSKISSSSSSSSWIKNVKIDKYLDGNYNEYDDTNLTNLISSLPDKSSHKYSKDVEISLKLFNKWRKWNDNNSKIVSNKNDNHNEWKLLSSENQKLDKYTDTKLNCYWNNINDSAISATKGKMILPYAAPIIAGIIENSNHECKYEEYTQSIDEIEYLNEYCSVYYAQTTAPLFVTARDILGIAFTYVLPNAEIIMGCRSIGDKDGVYNDAISKLNVSSKNYVRAFCTLDIYHIHPWYSRNSNYSVVTYYSHYNMNGSLPNWLINNMISDTPKVILTLKKYIDDNIKQLSGKKGDIHIPKDLFDYIDIDIDTNSYKIKDNNDNNNMEFAFNDDSLSDVDNTIDQFEKLGDNLEFVDVIQKFGIKQKPDAVLQTPISTPDIQLAHEYKKQQMNDIQLAHNNDNDNDNGYHSSDLGGDGSDIDIDVDVHNNVDIVDIGKINNNNDDIKDNNNNNVVADIVSNLVADVVSKFDDDGKDKKNKNIVDDDEKVQPVAIDNNQNNNKKEEEKVNINMDNDDDNDDNIDNNNKNDNDNNNDKGDNDNDVNNDKDN